MKEISHVSYYKCSDIDLVSLFHLLNIDESIHYIVYYDKTFTNIRYKRYYDLPKLKNPSFNKLQIQIRWKDYIVYIDKNRCWFITNYTVKQDLDLVIDMKKNIMSHIPIQGDLLQTDFRFLIAYQLSKCWNIYFFAHIISTHSKFRQWIAYSESQQPISAKIKKMIRVLHSRIVMTINTQDDYNLSIRISNTSSYDEACKIYAMMKEIFSYYNNNYDTIYELYNHHSPKEDKKDPTSSLYQSRIGYLRIMEPDLFISGYSRECPILPILINNVEEAERVNTYSFVIRYPIETGYYYTAPEGYFVSLKKNRMKNRDKYPYLVNCYREDHRLKNGSNLIKYYGEKVAKTSSRPLSTSVKKSSRIPPNLVIPFSHCEPLPEYIIDKRIVKQELDTIPLDEYTIEADIILIETDSSNLASIVIPKHVDQYIWRRKYDRCIIIIQEYKGAYGMKDLKYDIVVKDDGNCFYRYDDYDSIVRLAALKESHTTKGISSSYHIRDGKFISMWDTNSRVSQQYVDENGKCIVIWNDKNEEKLCYQEPLDVPLCGVDAISELVTDVEEAFKLGTIDQTQYLNFTTYKHIREECYVKLPRYTTMHEDSDEDI